MRIIFITFSLAFSLGLMSCSVQEKTKPIEFSLKVDSFTYNTTSEYQKDGTQFYIRFGDRISSQKIRRRKTGIGGVVEIPFQQQSVMASACSLPDAIGFKHVDIRESLVVEENIVIDEARKGELTFPNLTNSIYPIRLRADGWDEPEELIISVNLNGEDLPIGSICILHMISVKGDRLSNQPIQRLYKYFDINHGDLVLKTGREGADIWVNIVDGTNKLQTGEIILMGHSTDETGNIGFYANAELNFDR